MFTVNFWAIIGAIHKLRATRYEGVELSEEDTRRVELALLAELLVKYELEEVKSFEELFREMMRGVAGAQHLWLVLQRLEKPHGEEEMCGFRSWVVLRGEEKYKRFAQSQNLEEDLLLVLEQHGYTGDQLPDREQALLTIGTIKGHKQIQHDRAKPLFSYIRAGLNLWEALIRIPSIYMTGRGVNLARQMLLSEKDVLTCEVEGDVPLDGPVGRAHYAVFVGISTMLNKFLLLAVPDYALDVGSCTEYRAAEHAAYEFFREHGCDKLPA